MPKYYVFEITDREWIEIRMYRTIEHANIKLEWLKYKNPGRRFTMFSGEEEPLHEEEEIMYREAGDEE